MWKSAVLALQELLREKGNVGGKARSRLSSWAPEIWRGLLHLTHTAGK